jgi:hypothetical protein
MKKVLAILILITFLALPSEYALATFSLSVVPYEGGYDLKYGKISLDLGRLNKEVTVDIASDIGKQYRLVQTLLEPLTTPEGRSIPQGSFVVYAIRGTNKYGTLNVEQEIPVRFGRQDLYTSNQTGAPDSFTLVYGLTPSSDFEPGYYRGRISFTLEPIDSTQSPATAILSILAEVEIESTIEIRTITGTKEIMLKADKEDNNASVVAVEIKGGFGKQFRILQVVNEQPVSSEGNLLDWEAINFVGKDAQKGMVINALTPLSSQPQVIYTSSPRGEADSFVIEYSLGDLSRQKADKYMARIKYILEGYGIVQARLLDTMALTIENPRVFDLAVAPETGGSIQFRDLKPQQPPKIQEVTFEVNTNIGKPYQVTQNMLNLLVNREGKTIASRYFTLRQESLETKGILKYPEKTDIKQGEMVLFISDREGSSDKFKVIYELSIPSDIQPGDYSTFFTYSVSEI